MIVPFPALGIRRIEWNIDRPAQVNRSQYTRSRKVHPLPGASLWSGSFEMAPMNETQVLAWRAFIARLQGPVNSFRMVAVEGPQRPASGTVTAAATAAGATAIVTSGWSGALLKAGHMITVNEQLAMLTNPVVASGGNATLELDRPLHAAVTPNTVVETRLPTLLASMTGTIAGWTVDPGKLYGAGMSFEEAN